MLVPCIGDGCCRVDALETTGTLPTAACVSAQDLMDKYKTAIKSSCLKGREKRSNALATICADALGSTCQRTTNGSAKRHSNIKLLL